LYKLISKFKNIIMTFKNIVTSFVLALAVGVPSVSSAMTNEEAKDSLATIIQLVERAQSMLDEMELSGVVAGPLTALTSTSYDAKDANKDGKINYADIDFVTKVIAGNTGDTSADVNSDGKVDNADILALRAYFKSQGDYVNAYDGATIGANWTTVPADGKVDQNDVNAVRFAVALYESNNAYYHAASDFNADGKVDTKDLSILEKFIADGLEETDTEEKPNEPVAPVVEKTDFSPKKVEEGEREEVTITGNLAGLHSLVMFGPKAANHIIADFDQISSKEVVIKIPAEVAVGDYTIWLMFQDRTEEIKSSLLTIVDSTPDAPVVTLSLPQTDLPAGTTNSNLAVKTDIASKCSFSKTSGKAYTEMTPFQYNGMGTDLNIAFQPISGLPQNVQINYYVKCKSSNGVVMPNDYIIKFSVGKIS
jgi:hypothetical protein